MQGTFQFVWSMLFISSAVNFEPNCKTWNNRNFWQWQHVLLIMTHESALTLVIGGNGWARNIAYEFEWKRFPLAHSFLSFSQERLLWMNEWKMTFFSFWQAIVSHTVFCIVHLWEHHSILHHSGGLSWRNNMLGTFQHSINPCQCYLICYLFRFMAFPLPMWADCKTRSREAFCSWR